MGSGFGGQEAQQNVRLLPAFFSAASSPLLLALFPEGSITPAPFCSAAILTLYLKRIYLLS